MFLFLGLMLLIHTLVRSERRVTDTWERQTPVLLDITLAQLQAPILSPVPLDGNKTTRGKYPPLHIVYMISWGCSCSQTAHVHAALGK